MRRSAFALAAALLAGLPYAHAADSDGKFAIKGVGLAECSVYAAERAKQSPLHAMFLGWIDGYTTAYNQLSAATFDIAPWESTDLLATVVEAHCKKYPEHRFTAVVRSMFAKMSAERLQQDTPLLSVGSASEGFLLYRETMRRVQQRLSEAGLYNGALDGGYDAAVRTALQSFQRKSSLPVTGLPDQPTLWKLFRPAQN